jgi:predicted enzyme related to lactoylglutathione lyase
MAGSVCHVDIPSKDLAVSGEFYSAVFGWAISPMGEGYSLWKPQEGNAGGGFSLPEDGQPAAVLPYIHVDDIEATLAQINSKGGSTAMGKTKISDEHGFFAIFIDPAGNSMGLWSQT